MNFVVMIGRLTKDPMITYTNDGKSICKFGIAVDRRIKTGDQTADFFNVTTFGKTADFVEKWFRKGSPISLEGRIQTGSYTKQDGTKVYTTDIIAENVEFVPKTGDQRPEPTAETPEDMNDGFMKIPETAEGLATEGMPF